jgi:hypothetical protein
VDEWDAYCDERSTVPGRGGRENALFCSGKYGECPAYEDFRPPKYNKGAIEDIRTGLKMRVNASLDKAYQNHGTKSKERKWTSGLRKEIRVSVWDMMENAKIRVEKKPDEPRGWRE